jgi:Protein of unknown function (DUF3237)
MRDRTDSAASQEFPLVSSDRRSVLTALAAAACASVMPGKAFAVSQAGTDLPRTEFVFEASIKRADAMVVGPSKFGARRVVNLLGGTFEGPKIKGEIPVGGTSLYVARADGVTMVSAQYVLKTDDGAVIFTRNEGLVVPMPNGPPYIRTTASFEAPVGPYEWLNKALFLGIAHPNPAAQTSNLAIYKLL